MSEQPSTPGKTRVLVFPCGAENALEVHSALRYSLHVELYGASSVEDHGRFAFTAYTGDLPRIDEAGFDAAFAALVTRLKIDVVFATHDSVHEYLAPQAAALGFHLVNGDPETSSIARRKSSTYAAFGSEAWLPRRYGGADDVDSWPVVVKPDLGQGGQQVTVAASRDACRRAAAAMSDPVIVEYLPGEEITVDCFTDRHRALLWIGPRTRERVRAGIAMRSRLLEADETIRSIAEAINARLKLRGPWFFQLKKDRAGVWKLLEISCRIAGTMAAQRAWGINLPLMAIQDVMGRDLLTLPEPRVGLIDRRIATKAQLDYEYAKVFIDLDDTLLIDGHAVPLVLHFLYQCRAEGKQIVLITRHGRECRPTLEEASISPQLFSEIIHITDRSPKSDYISPNSIFIDNHFPERLEVSRRLGIPVFDVEALEFLIR